LQGLNTGKGSRLGLSFGQLFLLAQPRVRAALWHEDTNNGSVCWGALRTLFNVPCKNRNTIARFQGLCMQHTSAKNVEIYTDQTRQKRRLTADMLLTWKDGRFQRSTVSSHKPLWRFSRSLSRSLNSKPNMGPKTTPKYCKRALIGQGIRFHTIFTPVKG
jgi:hypothetical protein